MKLRFLAAFLAIITLGLTPVSSAAQSSGSLAVSIKDNYGALPGTTVRLVDKDGRSAGRAVTDGSGLARFSSLAAGEYTVKANLTGFADGEKGGVVVGNTEEKVELVLTLARFSTTVTVTTASFFAMSPSSVLADSRVGTYLGSVFARRSASTTRLRAHCVRKE